MAAVDKNSVLLRLLGQVLLTNVGDPLHLVVDRFHSLLLVRRLRRHLLWRWRSFEMLKVLDQLQYLTCGLLLYVSLLQVIGFARLLSILSGHTCQSVPLGLALGLLLFPWVYAGIRLVSVASSVCPIVFAVLQGLVLA